MEEIRKEKIAKRVRWDSFIESKMRKVERNKREDVR